MCIIPVDPPFAVKTCNIGLCRVARPLGMHDIFCHIETDATGAEPLDWALSWDVDEAMLKRILVDNPEALYGFD